MRRLMITLMVLGVAAMLMAPAALATFHETRVTEVLTSNQGTATEQFVELQDPAEPFPAAAGPYWLVVYNAAGAELGAEPLSNTALATDAAQGPMLISTAAYDAAAGTSGDFTLAVSLPIAAGQACFAHEAGKAPVHCMTWGTIQNQIAGPLAPPTSGAAPGDGLSLQKQCDGSGAVAAPTPGAANAVATAACIGKPPVSVPAPEAGPTTPSPHNPGGGNAQSAFGGVTVHRHSVAASGNGRVSFVVACPAQTRGRCAGRVTLEDGSRSVGASAFSIAAGKSGPVALRLRPAELEKLTAKGKLKLHLTIAAHDGAGTAAPDKVVRVTVR